MRQRVWMFCCFVLCAFLAMGLVACQCDNTGTGTYAELEVQPENVIFPAIPVGQTTEREVLLRNIGQVALTLSSLTLKPLERGEAFSLLDVEALGLPIAIEPRQSVRVKIRYAPQGAGAASSYLSIVHTGRNVGDTGDTRVPVRSSQVSGALFASPNPLDFGKVAPDQSKTLTLTLTNQGQADVQVRSSSWEGNAEGAFTLEKDITYPTTLKPGESAKLDVKYTPKGHQSEAALSFVHDASAQPLVVRIVGERDAPRIILEPVRLLFDDVPTGSQGKRTFVIRNAGSQPLVVSGVNLSPTTAKEFTLDGLPSFPLTLEADKTQQITVSYTAVEPKPAGGSVEVSSNDPDTPTATVALEVQPSGCILNALPTQLLFLRSEDKTVTLSNQGNKDCTLKKASFSATTSREFDFVQAPQVPAVIAPGKILEFKVRFTKADDNADEGRLVLETDDPLRPTLEIPLLSRDPSSSPCELRAIPSTLSFGFVPTGASRPGKVQVENIGYEDCTLFQANLTVNPSQVFSLQTTLDTQGEKIPPGQRFVLDLAYTPRGAAQSQGSLVLLSSDKGNPQLSVTLIGASGQACIEVLPSPLDMGSTQQGCRGLDYSLEVLNTCQDPLTISALQFDGKSNDPEFRLRQAPNLPFTLLYGQSATVKLAYVPSALGPDQRTFEVVNSAPGQSPYIVPLSALGVDTDEQTDTFQQIGTPKVDILFVIDDSNSMEDNQNNLSANLSSFFQWASRLQVDYHIAVTTTDADCGISGSKYKLGGDGMCQRGNRPPIPATGCFRGIPTVVTPQTPNGVQKFADNVKVGLQGSGAESGLTASYYALQPDRLNGCNKGFYRSEAALSIIYVSDETDSSPEAVQFYVNFFRSLKGVRGDDVRASAVVGPEPNGCTPPGGTTVKAAPRYWEIANLMKGVQAPICDQNWSNTLNQLGAVTFGLRSQFFLSRPAEPGSIVVKVDGKIISQGGNGWTFDAAANSITFDVGATPQVGSTVTVTYKARCLAP
ncbi:MAG: choice-of-anchor D domain-containing protein [Myxococcales bacterium]|nr:choice-of-anchor D domain-containing protein [Myxococcales bacterium]MCB9642520.1 choice-of-anchor D domain-containing protein [Myxococcales bacterium]